MQSKLMKRHGQWAIRHRQSKQAAEELMKAAHAMRTGVGSGYTASRRMRFLAAVPEILQVEWLNRYGRSWRSRDALQDRLRLLRDPNYRNLRLTEGRF